MNEKQPIMIEFFAEAVEKLAKDFTPNLQQLMKELVLSTCSIELMRWECISHDDFEMSPDDLAKRSFESIERKIKKLLAKNKVEGFKIFKTSVRLKKKVKDHDKKSMA